MTRTQILALSAAATLAVIGGVLVWQGLSPSAPPVKPPSESQNQTPAPKPSVAEPAPTAPAVKPQAIIPEFDTVRVEPSGETVVAGHGEPNAKIALMAGDKILGEAQANAGGDFVIVPEPLAPGNYLLSLRSTSGSAAAIMSEQTITVSVPAKGQKGVIVALTQPGKPSKLLSDPTVDTGGAPQPGEASKPTVAIKTAEVDKGGFYTSGLAPAGSHLRIYLNGSALADVIADAEGKWSLTIGKGVTAGHYILRADAIDAKGKVIARAEVPFDVPVTIAETGDGKPKPAASSADSSRAIVSEISTVTVARGDSLWRISQKLLGQGLRYTSIYQANASQIRDPNLIYPGQVFVLPH
jgi:nucleoid-associated protein YgaU